MDEKVDKLQFIYINERAILRRNSTPAGFQNTEKNAWELEMEDIYLYTGFQTDISGAGDFTDDFNAILNESFGIEMEE